jgi:hypothetical protein
MSASAVVRTQSADLLLGAKNEIENEPLIKKLTNGMNFRKTSNPYHAMDWRCVDTLVSAKTGEEYEYYLEQKSRTQDLETVIRISQTPKLRQNSCIIGANKHKYLKENKAKGIIIFKFDDVSLYRHYAPTAFSKFKKQEFQRTGRNKDGETVDYKHKVLHIPWYELKVAPYEMDGSEMDKAKYDRYTAMIESTRKYDPEHPTYTVESIPMFRPTPVCLIVDDE